jgi:hypothetical protein
MVGKRLREHNLYAKTVRFAEQGKEIAVENDRLDHFYGFQTI